jgi:hypothetical protein
MPGSRKTRTDVLLALIRSAPRTFAAGSSAEVALPAPGAWQPPAACVPQLRPTPNPTPAVVLELQWKC